MDKIKFSHCLLAFLIGYIIYNGGTKAYENYQIDDEGILTYGQIYDKVSLHRKVMKYYRFKVNGDVYYGNTIYDNNLHVGDPILIKYIKDNPSRNESYTTIKGLFFRKKANITRDSIWYESLKNLE